MELGSRFWLGILAVGVGMAVGSYLIFVFIGYAWYAWGFFGMLLVFGAVLSAIAYIHDRREAKRRRGVSPV